MEELLEPDLRPLDDEPFGEELPPEPSGSTRLRVLLAAAAGPLVTGYAVVAALFTLITVAADGATFSVLGVLKSAGPGWLAAHQVPVVLAGRTLGLLPLLPTIGLAVLIARTAAGTAQRLGCREARQALPIIGVIALAHATCGAVIALIADGKQFSVSVFAAFAIPGVFAALAATVGLASRSGMVHAAREYLDPLAIRGLRAGALGLAALLAGGAIVCVLSLSLSATTVYDLFEPGFGNSLGLFLLSVGYLPNAVVAGLSFAAGPGFSFGTVSVSPFSFSGGSVPGVPLLAGIPAHHAIWWPVLMLLPAAAGVLVGLSVRDIDANPMARFRTVGVAGALVGFGCVVLGTLAGGKLGHGPFDPVSVPVGVASVVAFGWIVVPGCLVAYFAGRRAEVPVEELVVPEADVEPLEDVEEFEDGSQEDSSQEDTDELDEDLAEEPDAEVEQDEPEVDDKPESDEAVTELTAETEPPAEPPPADEQAEPDR